MIPYMVGKLAPNSSHLTRRLVKYVPGRDYFRAVPSQNGEKYVTSPPPPIVDLVTSDHQDTLAGGDHRVFVSVAASPEISKNVELYLPRR